MAEDRAPWEVIRAAADKIQSLELYAVSGPWESGERCVWGTGNGAAVVSDGSVGDGGCSEGTAAWIAALSPAVAEPLVAWLMEESEFIHGLRSQRVPFPRTQHALDFARRVLGERGP